MGASAAARTSLSGRAAIIGGGITGLSCAFRLIASELRPVVFEADDEVGGVGRSFDHHGVGCDRFYHVLLNTDSHLLGLIAALGASQRVCWRQVRMGVCLDKLVYPFTKAQDLMSFRPMSCYQRIRAGLGGAYISRCARGHAMLDSIRCEDWLKYIFGSSVYSCIWRPLLTAKFGPCGEDVPAYWVWSRANREMSGGCIRGYIKGGYSWLSEALAGFIQQGGGEVRVLNAVTGLDEKPDGIIVESKLGREMFDVVISTIPMHLLDTLFRGDLRSRAPGTELRYRSVVNVVLILRTPLQSFYSVAVLDDSVPFHAIVETTNVIPLEWTGQRHIVYLAAYCSSGDDMYSSCDGVLIEKAMRSVSTLFPGFRPEHVEGSYVFRAPYVEPVWPMKYLKQKFGPRIGVSRVYVCTMAQGYPSVPAWNTGVRVAGDTVDCLIGRNGA